MQIKQLNELLEIKITERNTGGLLTKIEVNSHSHTHTRVCDVIFHKQMICFAQWLMSFIFRGWGLSFQKLNWSIEWKTTLNWKRTYAKILFHTPTSFSSYFCISDRYCVLCITDGISLFINGVWICNVKSMQSQSIIFHLSMC